mgnify:FL=1
MQIAVASGKGGTGKTTVATSFALSMTALSKVRFIDCDVEAPNGHLFLHPHFTEKTQAVIQIPHILSDKCVSCGRCVEVCQFHALALVGNNILVFPQLCHGCGSCTWNCPEKAIVEIPNPIGVLEKGMTEESIEFFRGQLTISEPMPTPVIRQLKKLLQPSSNTIEIFDAPPGASCSVVETLRGMDFILLVTEPTPFGLHDLKQIIAIIREMEIPAGVIINRAGIGDHEIESFCSTENLPIFLRIPFDRQIAEGISAGKTLVEILPNYSTLFQQLIKQIQEDC